MPFAVVNHLNSEIVTACGHGIDLARKYLKIHKCFGVSGGDSVFYYRILSALNTVIDKRREKSLGFCAVTREADVFAVFRDLYA